jgi:hypothetical protein
MAMTYCRHRTQITSSVPIYTFTIYVIIKLQYLPSRKADYFHIMLLEVKLASPHPLHHRFDATVTF